MCHDRGNDKGEQIHDEFVRQGSSLQGMVLRNTLMDMSAKYGTITKGDLPQRIEVNVCILQACPRKEPVTKGDKSTTNFQGEKLLSMDMV